MSKKQKLIEHVAGASGEKMPRVKGTRVRVSDIAVRYQQLEHETPAERIQYSFPHLDIEEIEAAIEYWRSHPDEIAAEIAAEEALLEELRSRR